MKRRPSGMLIMSNRIQVALELPFIIWEWPSGHLYFGFSFDVLAFVGLLFWGNTTKLSFVHFVTSKLIGMSFQIIYTLILSFHFYYMYVKYDLLLASTKRFEYMLD